MVVHCAGTDSAEDRRGAVALRSAVAAPALVNTPSLTPLEYSSGPATLLIE